MLWLLRHGDAEEDEDDFDRRLTEKGTRQSVLGGRALAVLGAELDACLTSPRVRARQTAELACAALGIEPDEERALSGGHFDVADLTAGRGEVLLVGHEPDLSNAIAELTGARANLKKGGIAAIEDGELRLLLTPRAIAAIGED